MGTAVLPLTQPYSKLTCLPKYQGAKASGVYTRDEPREKGRLREMILSEFGLPRYLTLWNVASSKTSYMYINRYGLAAFTPYPTWMWHFFASTL